MSRTERALLWLATVLALLALATVVMAERAGEPIGPRPTPTPTPASYPADGVYVYERDPTCPGSSNVVPPVAPAVCMRAKALEWLRSEVEFGRLLPGPAWRDCSRGSSWSSCLEYAFLRYSPEIRYGQSAKWVYGNRAQVEGWYCAAGIGYSTYIRVSLAHSTYRLVAWETLNSALRYRLDRGDITDSSAVVGVGVNAAAAACGVQ